MRNDLKQYIQRQKQFWEWFPQRKKNGIAVLTYNIVNESQCEDFKYLTVEWIAQQIGISESHLSRCCKALFKSSPGEFIIGRKIAVAKDLLVRCPDLSMEEIAEKIDYCNANYFIKVFKKKTKITPLQYRKKTIAERKKTNHLKRLAIKIEKAINQTIAEATGGKFAEAVIVHGGLGRHEDGRRSNFFF